MTGTMMWRALTGDGCRVIPDRVIPVSGLPLGATGKVLKARLRETYGDVLFEEA